MVAHELHSPRTTEPRRWRLVSAPGGAASSSGSSPSEVLTVLGGKASCRRKFVLSVHLVDELDRPAALPDGAHLSVLASVAYAHDLSPVVRDEGRPFLSEPPLLTTFNGVEFPAHERPTRLQAGGGASFKLALSLLSSKCDNRLFCIRFTPISSTIVCSPCYSRPIRSISRKRTQASASPPLPAAMEPRPPSSPASSGDRRPGSVTSFRQDEDEEATAELMSPSPPKLIPSPRDSSGGSPNTTSESCVENQPPPPLPVRPFRPYASVGACNVGELLNTDSTTTTTTMTTRTLLEKVQQLRGAAPQLWSPAGGGELGLSLLEEEERSLEFIEASLREASRELQRRKEELRSKRRRLLLHGPETRCSSMAIYSK